MVALDVKSKPTSTREVAIALEKRGFEVATYDQKSQMVAFHGCDETGHKAVKNIQKMGLHPKMLKRVWSYMFLEERSNVKNGVPMPYWELSFFFEPLVPEFTTLEEIKEAISQQRNALTTQSKL